MTFREGEAPLLSVILPVRDVADYLPACLRSIFAQPSLRPGLEVVAVDDASTDSSGVILNGWAASDPRLRVLHLPAPEGPGPARMHGLAVAHGRYVWFVDPDDMLAPGSLAAVCGRLAQDAPDVLLIDYLILHGCGRNEPSPWAELLGGPSSNPVLTGQPALTSRPALLNRTMTVWSKVVRRSFLASLGVRFGPGIHEDVLVSCALLLRAERIGLLADTCYLYRRRRGSFLATPSMGHFAIFRAYEQVFALADRAGGLPPEIAAALFGRAIEHYSSILASGLVPPEARRQYFRRMAADYQSYRPPGYHRPPGPRGVKFALIERDAFLSYTFLSRLNAARPGILRERRQPGPEPGHPI